MTMREPLAVGESTARAVLMERSVDKAEIVAVGGPFRGESRETITVHTLGLEIVIVKAWSCTCAVVIRLHAKVWGRSGGRVSARA
jgi:hypothetical protein